MSVAFPLTGSPAFASRCKPKKSINAKLATYNPCPGKRSYWHHLASNYRNNSTYSTYFHELEKNLKKLGPESLNCLHHGWTPLHVAVLKCNRAAIEFFIQHDASCDIPGADGMTAREYAQGYRRDLLPLLTKKDYLANRHLLLEKSDLRAVHECAAWGDIEALNALLEGVDPNVRDEKGETPLHVAALWGHVDAINLLVEKGAEDIPANNGFTLLRAFAFPLEFQPGEFY